MSSDVRGYIRVLFYKLYPSLSVVRRLFPPINCAEVNTDAAIEDIAHV